MRFLVVLAMAGLSGCATSSYCTEDQTYQSARSVAPVAGVEGLQLPQSPTALRIPPPPAKPVAYGEVYQDSDGDELVRCLDAPPVMPAVVTPPAAPPKGEEKAPG